MKISLKLEDHHHRENRRHDHQPAVLLRAKVPVTIFNLPFLSHFSATTKHPSDLSLSLSTNFPSFPSLRLSYATAPAAAAPPLTVTLKSGTGLFGSPANSPLVISAHFSFNPCNPNHPNPTFSLFLKPQLGSFSLWKSTFSHSAGCDSESSSPACVNRDLSIEKGNASDSIYKGIKLAATTQLPVSKRAAVNFRWWVNFAGDQMPVLRINKIGIQRLEDVSILKDDDGSEGREVESNAFKSMCLFMKNELDGLTRVNREMKCELEEMKVARNNNVKATPITCVVESPSSGGFEQWRSKRNGEENRKTEEKISGHSPAIDVESELQRAIMAASSSRKL